MWSIVFFSIIFLVILFFGILLVTNYYSYIDRSSVKISLPYILSIKPLMLEKNGNLSITLSKIDNKNTITNLSLTIIGPSVRDNLFITSEGKQFERHINKSFNQDGNYSVILIDNLKNRILIMSTFEVHSSPIIFLKFIYGQGLGFFIGLIVPFLTLLLERGIRIRDNKLQRLRQKSEWMSSNSKYYMDTASSGEEVAKFFERYKITYFKPLRIQDFVFNIVKFYSDFKKMQQNIGYYYFESTKEEDFVLELGSNIMDTIHYTIFKGVDIESFIPLYNSSYIKSIPNDLTDSVLNWFNENNLDNKGLPRPFYDLEGDNSIKKFYMDILLYSWILYTTIHNGMSITYENPKKEKEKHFKLFSKYRTEMQKRLDTLNEDFKKQKKIDALNEDSNNKSDDDENYDFFKQFSPTAINKFNKKFNNLLRFKQKYIIITSSSYLILLALLVTLCISIIISFNSYYSLDKIFVINVILSVTSLVILITIIVDLKKDLN